MKTSYKIMLVSILYLLAGYIMYISFGSVGIYITAAILAVDLQVCYLMRKGQ
jgi:hypothetical protein